MNKKILFVLTFIFIIACGEADKQAQLRELETQRNELSAKIDALRSEIAAQNGGEQGVLTYVEVDQLKPQIFNHYIKVQGTVTSDNNIMIPAQASGLVKRIYVKEGDIVKKGQLLAEIDGAIYESNIAELKTNLALARTLYERQERLWKQKIGSEVQYLQAKTNKESLENRLASVKEQYRLTKFIAPINGSVDQIKLKENEATAAGMGGIRVVQLSKLKIEAKISEKYIDDLRVGDEVEVSLPVLDKTFTSKIRAVSQVIDPENRTFPIEIEVPDEHKIIKPNMLTVLTINDYTNENALIVPMRILQNTGTDQFLFTAIKSEKQDIYIAKKQIVKVGTNNGIVAEIKSGLQAGENIVTQGFQELADGQQVILSTVNANGK